MICLQRNLESVEEINTFARRGMTLGDRIRRKEESALSADSTDMKVIDLISFLVAQTPRATAILQEVL